MQINCFLNILDIYYVKECVFMSEAHRIDGWQKYDSGAPGGQM